MSTYIIAVLVALLVPQYIKYVEKSKITADQELLDNIQHVIEVAVTDENIIHKPLDGLGEDLLENINSSGKYDDFYEQVKLNLATDDLSILKRLDFNHLTTGIKTYMLRSNQISRLL